MNGYNFTERTRKVLARAREESNRLGHEYVGTERILLGLIREGEGVATAVMHAMSIDPHEVTRRVEATVNTGAPRGDGNYDLPYTSRSRKALELAMSEARDQKHGYVGTEHLLLGLPGAPSDSIPRAGR